MVEVLGLRKERSRKQVMADLKEFCKRTYGEDWRRHYLKRWKEYRKGR